MQEVVFKKKTLASHAAQFPDRHDSFISKPILFRQNFLPPQCILTEMRIELSLYDRSEIYYCKNCAFVHCHMYCQLWSDTMKFHQAKVITFSHISSDFFPKMDTVVASRQGLKDCISRSLALFASQQQSLWHLLSIKTRISDTDRCLICVLYVLYMHTCR